MPKNNAVIWEAKPHTIAKIEILRSYLDAYFPILGSTRSNKILYIDAFAGPGEYINYPSGSPVIAIESALRSMEIPNWQASEVHFAFIESNRRRLENLRKKLEPYQSDPRIRIHFYRGEFEEMIEQVKADVPEPFYTTDPLFVFIDPFGVKGVPFRIVESILRVPTSEVFLNLDADGIQRVFYQVRQRNRANQLTELFGSKEWERLHHILNFEEKCFAALTLYTQRLREIGTRYVWSFEMRSHTNLINYFLVFAGNHRRGLEKMKPAMNKVARDGTYIFRDPNIKAQNITPQKTVSQFSMFDEQEPEIDEEEKREKDILLYYVGLFLLNFGGLRVPYETLCDFTLNNTRYVKPNQILKALDESKSIVIENKENNSRRRLSHDNIVAVTFKVLLTDDYQKGDQ